MGLFRVIRIMRIARVTLILTLFASLIVFVYVTKDRMAIITLNEYAKEREAQSDYQVRWGVYNLSANFTGKDCTHFGRLLRR